MGKTCTFFGHRDCPETVRSRLRAVLTELIEREGADRFYVGRQGAFDAMVRSVLRELAASYPQITYAVVLERLPRPGEPAEPDTVFPEGLERVPPRFAVARRNDWMLRQADLVVTYVTRSWGGAARYAEKARQQKKALWNLL